MHINELETPALVVDQVVLEENIQRMANYCKQRRINLRADVSCHKSPMIAYKQVAAGAYGIACQNLSEAEVFADAGFDDILILDNIVEQKDLDRLIRLAERVSVGVTADSLSVTEGISRAAKCAGHHIPILIEMDTSGMQASPQTPQAIVELGMRIIIFHMWNWQG